MSDIGKDVVKSSAALLLEKLNALEDRLENNVSKLEDTVQDICGKCFEECKTEDCKPDTSFLSQAHYRVSNIQIHAERLIDCLGELSNNFTM